MRTPPVHPPYRRNGELRECRSLPLARGRGFETSLKGLRRPFPARGERQVQRIGGGAGVRHPSRASTGRGAAIPTMVRGGLCWPDPGRGERRAGVGRRRVGKLPTMAEGAEPGTDGPRCGDPYGCSARFMVTRSASDWSVAQVVAKSPCRGVARRCAAA